MTQTIEKELKTAISLEHYTLLLNHFNVNPTHYIKQHNLYYDTTDGKLRQNKAGLRVRLVDTTAEFTLKESIRTHEKLETTDTFELLQMTPHTFVSGDVSEKLLKTYHISLDALTVIGELINERYEIHAPEGIWAIDKSHFPSGVTYELEFEYTTTPQPFYDLLKQLSIPYVKVASKLSRALFQSTQAK
ncbi:CYTH domain-containing protein [Carnobacteriaceae bacterium zg-C25]|nr:CYTH domain-containing protein [Carnobacteriaceae bacterium zg-C25]